MHKIAPPSYVHPDLYKLWDLYIEGEIYRTHPWFYFLETLLPILKK